ncbi:uncharacterized protein LOC122650423 [Telopea speciosissima]|uniref:uncharacterized protein LOC122650423 n=1 Tax=Telopea speciosissima TaxID=54955 RepID=UPI001CC41685|nr:uncharacterized protein LOC122650423 [Telopea speciosissima]
MKREAEMVVVVVSSCLGSDEEPEEEEEEEAKSSNNSNQNSNLAPREEEEEEAEVEEEDGNNVKRTEKLSNGVAVSGCFPTHRIKQIIRSEGDFRTNAEAIFLINQATEKFVESLAEDAYACSGQHHEKYINYKHLLYATPRLLNILNLMRSDKAINIPVLLGNVAWQSSCCYQCYRYWDLSLLMPWHAPMLFPDNVILMCSDHSCGNHTFLGHSFYVLDVVPKKMRAEDALEEKRLAGT